MNENEIDRIARAVAALRPDWPVASVRTLIATRLAARTRRDVAVALTWVACDSASKTPARVLEAGPWWQHVVSDESHGRRSYNMPCPNHSDHQLPCRLCAAKRVPAEEPNAAALARAALAQSLAQLCPHGVKRGLVKCGECERPDRDVPAAELDPATPPDHDTAPSAEEETA